MTGEAINGRAWPTAGVKSVVENYVDPASRLWRMENASELSGPLTGHPFEADSLIHLTDRYSAHRIGNWQLPGVHSAIKVVQRQEE